MTSCVVCVYVVDILTPSSLVSAFGRFSGSWCWSADGVFLMFPPILRILVFTACSYLSWITRSGFGSFWPSSRLHSHEKPEFLVFHSSGLLITRDMFGDNAYSNLM